MSTNVSTHCRPIFKVNVSLIVGVTQFRECFNIKPFNEQVFCLKRLVRFDETFQSDVDAGNVVVY